MRVNKFVPPASIDYMGKRRENFSLRKAGIVLRMRKNFEEANGEEEEELRTFS